MPSFNSELLRGRSRPAIRALFDAYELEKESSRTFLRDLLSDLPQVPNEPLLDNDQRTTEESYVATVSDENEGPYEFDFNKALEADLYVIAGCIVAIGDNLIKACAIENLDKPERLRRYFGDVIAGDVQLGAALQAGANAFRHAVEWEAGDESSIFNRTILESLGVPLDDSASHRILELSQTTNADAFLNAIDVTCSAMEQAAPCDDCGHPASYHRRNHAQRGAGCSYRPGLADGLPSGSISEVVATVLERNLTGQYRCACRSTREVVVDAFLMRCS
jgi:hypothetical protein